MLLTVRNKFPFLHLLSGNAGCRVRGRRRTREANVHVEMSLSCVQPSRTLGLSRAQSEEDGISVSVFPSYSHLVCLS